MCLTGSSPDNGAASACTQPEAGEAYMGRKPGQGEVSKVFGPRNPYPSVVAANENSGE